MSREDYERISAELDPARQKDHPRAYDTLSPEEKEALLYWIGHAIQEATKADDDHTSYGLKFEYERETNLHVSNAQFKGAMLVAGYQPTKPGEQNWHFMIQPAHKESRASRKNQRTHDPVYRSSPQGEQDPQFAALIQAALAFRKGSGVIQ
jgi:hypothetical protein